VTATDVSATNPRNAQDGLRSGKLQQAARAICEAVYGAPEAGPQFTCFTSTEVQILTPAAAGGSTLLSKNSQKFNKKGQSTPAYVA